MKLMVAGIGNVFLSDDAFGVEVVRALGDLPDGVRVLDSGIRGMHLAYELLDGYDAVVLVDATRRGGEPGTLYTLEHDLDAPRPGGATLDGHGMDPASVLDLLRDLATSMGVQHPVGRVLVVGCEPACLDEGIGLSPAVEAAVGPGVETVRALVGSLVTTEGVRG